MKIEKKKVVKNSKLSRFTKSAVAAALGIAASIGTTACDDSISATSGDHPKQPETNPTCGQAACGEQYSSSSYTDISSSGEHLSSEAIEALSSAKLPKSSSSIISAGIPHTYSSSSVEKPSSSSYEPIIEAGILPFGILDVFRTSQQFVLRATSRSRHSSAIRRIFLKRNAVKQFLCRARTSRWRPHYYRKQLERKYA